MPKSQPPALTETAAERNARLATQTYLTPEDAATYLRYSTVDAFRKWAAKALVPRCKTGTRILFRRRDLDRAVQPSYIRAKGA